MEKKLGWHFEKLNADSLMLNNWNNIDIQDYTRFYILYNRQYGSPLPPSYLELTEAMSILRQMLSVYD